MTVISGVNSAANEDDVFELSKYVQNMPSEITNFNGVISLEAGLIVSSNATIIHKRSVGEDVIISRDGNLVTGDLEITNGSFVERGLNIRGKSLIDSAELTAKAFSQSSMNEYGGYLVAIALLLFAFSTAIAWCYYGDRSTAYIFGEKGVFWYRNFYVLCFILAAVIDTEVVWNIAYVVVALVSIPNLIAIFVLRREMKEDVDNYKLN